MTTLYIKNMVCDRCITVLSGVFAELGAELESIVLGRAVIRYNPDQLQLARIEKALEAHGFELIQDKDRRTVDRIKTSVIRLLSQIESKEFKGKNSDFIAQDVGINYFSLSRLFSQMEGISIERYIILMKVQKARELLEYDELTLAEIAFRLGYSSAQHLSSQFKSITGTTVSEFRSSRHTPRQPMDKLID